MKAAEVPLLVGEVMGADQQGACANMNQTIADVPKIIATAQVISWGGWAGRPDRWHFTPAGYRELGRRYAEAMLPLPGYLPGGKK